MPRGTVTSLTLDKVYVVFSKRRMHRRETFALGLVPTPLPLCVPAALGAGARLRWRFRAWVPTFVSVTDTRGGADGHYRTASHADLFEVIANSLLNIPVGTADSVY